MKWIEYSESKPTSASFYFVKGKKDMKAVIFYDSESNKWEIGDLPSNYFSVDEIRWLLED